MSQLESSEALSLPPQAMAARTRFPWQAMTVVAALLAALGLVPLVVGDYWLSAVLTPFLALSLAGLGLNILTGYAGQASLGAGALMSIGAFASYNFLLRLPFLPLPVSLALGGGVAAAAGVVFGLPSLRIRGFYLLASTLGAQFFVEWAFTKYGWFSNYASSGAISAPHLRLAGYDLSSPAGRYLLTASSTALLTWIAWNLVTSQTGRTWTGIRDMNTAAGVIGISSVQAKLTAFVASSFILGIAGALWVFAYLGTADAHSFDIDRSFEILFLIIIGGLGSLLGNFLGAGLILVFPIFLDRLGHFVLAGVVDTGLLQNLQKVFFGVLIIFLLRREPRGLAAYVTRLLHVLPRR